MQPFTHNVLGNIVQSWGRAFGVSNPASAYCAQRGGNSQIRTDPATGSQYGVCVAQDGTTCEEWAFMRGDCSLAMSPSRQDPELAGMGRGGNTLETLLMFGMGAATTYFLFAKNSKSPRLYSALGGLVVSVLVRAAR